ncbi:hypothetical protein PMIT1320_01285 [Prochlorococcus marinus str. MIT 1320]|nr:hypothetical protein PMIT1320_01285 [Prochlorococcus marinus str. MIT 1320]
MLNIFIAYLVTIQVKSVSFDGFELQVVEMNN